MDKMAENIHEYRIIVDAKVIDGNGHVNNVVYVDWMQRAALSHAVTWRVEELMARDEATWFARRHGIEYLRPVFKDEEIKVCTWIESAERVKSLRRYEFFRGEEMVARGETEWVYVKTTTGRPKRIPLEMREFIRQVDQ
ncbi:acyl-CoA thioesterase [Akkermansiaceae bacterium]|nr:acyl-CoA thioesterase [Akkermansiaceae bacterium]